MLPLWKVISEYERNFRISQLLQERWFSCSQIRARHRRDWKIFFLNKILLLLSTGQFKNKILPAELFPRSVNRVWFSPMNVEITAETHVPGKNGTEKAQQLIENKKLRSVGKIWFLTRGWFNKTMNLAKYNRTFQIIKIVSIANTSFWRFLLLELYKVVDSQYKIQYHVILSPRKNNKTLRRLNRLEDIFDRTKALSSIIKMSAKWNVFNTERTVK